MIKCSIDNTSLK
jgi:hypothetical protein